MSILKKIRQRTATENANAEAEWTSLVARLAVNEATVAEKEVAAALKTSGKSLEELERLVAHERHLNDLKSQITRYSTAVQTQRRLQLEYVAFRKKKLETERALNMEQGKWGGITASAGVEVGRIQAAAEELARLTGRPVILPRVPEAPISAE